MSRFEVKVVQIQGIDAHTNADALDLARVHGYRSVVRKGEYKPGDLAVYIPEGAIVPKEILVTLGLWDWDKDAGRLAGKEGNRVKAIRLRGEISQGLLMKPLPGMAEGDDVAATLGITKWDPPIPPAMNGEVVSYGTGVFPGYDIENIQRWPDVLTLGEMVRVTEKLHGTMTGFCHDPQGQANRLIQSDTGGVWMSFSKGLGSKGLVFADVDQNKRNIYLRSLKRALDNGLDGKIAEMRSMGFCGLTGDMPVSIFGETFGEGVQDLNYGQKGIAFRVFDVYFGHSGNGFWLNDLQLKQFAAWAALDLVPVLYSGSFYEGMVEEYRDGSSTFDASQIREGIVITPHEDRRHLTLGRVILKAVSPDYLTRKGSATEYQ